MAVVLVVIDRVYTIDYINMFVFLYTYYFLLSNLFLSYFVKIYILNNWLKLYKFMINLLNFS